MYHFPELETSIKKALVESKHKRRIFEKKCKKKTVFSCITKCLLNVYEMQQGVIVLPSEFAIVGRLC